ncbi:putative fatty acyl-CoA reductase CG8306 [Pseudomyrmex gracilis]|uniref:putative fatty acyl-CoA reductase CG8306 n=1 Tax=Pseudomyrmex gracilis TaxID=219809 RepID=UPI0009957A57|nr:putative fatty acyl-CoA reductase CG8306 [Pseudomyrmex gracilis]
MSSQVADFYNEKNIFITGGTGFVGVSLVEKLLRCCPKINNIYLLIRPKKGKQITERLEELTKNSVFDRLREENQTNLFKKLIAIPGDIGEDNLGLSSEDRTTLINNIQVVFHSAATLDFEADLKTTTNINLLGTRRIIELCREIKYLKVLVYVSSAYVSTMWQNVDEKVYPVPIDANSLIKLVDTLDIATLNEKTPEILNGHGNPYTLTKHLAEHEIVNAGFPATIVRPSMIIGAWKEPVPGWTISKNGPQGFLMGASKGIVRRLPVAPDLIYDYIPIDIVVNSLIVSAYNIDRDSDQGVKVYHCTSSTCNPFRWQNVEKDINTILHKYPLQNAVWYPYLKFLPSIFLFKISAIFVHFIPAYIFDTIIGLCGGRRILVRLHTNVNSSLSRLEKFIFQEWKFNNPRILQLHESLSSTDQELFTLDIKSLDWRDFFIGLARGIRTYLHKESPNSLPKARFKNKILLFANLGVQAAVFTLIWWLVKISLGTTWTKTAMVVPLVYLLFNQI